jgi:hypothetical protein
MFGSGDFILAASSLAEDKTLFILIPNAVPPP